MTLVSPIVDKMVVNVEAKMDLVLNGPLEDWQQPGQV
jgi:hypothetical protein